MYAHNLLYLFQETRKHFKNMGATENLTMALEFDDPNITLDIPLPSGVEVDEWSLVPLFLPMVILSL